MQSNDGIEVVAPLGGGVSEVNLFPDATLVLAGTAGVLVGPGRIVHAARRHLSSLECDVALLVRRIEIPVIGRNGEVAGVLCCNSPLISDSRSTPLAQDQHAAIMDEATKIILHDIANILATIDCGLSLLERQTKVEGTRLIVDRMRRSLQRGASSIRKLLRGNWIQKNGHKDITTRRDLVAAAEDLRHAVGPGRSLHIEIARGVGAGLQDRHPERLVRCLRGLRRQIFG